MSEKLTKEQRAYFMKTLLGIMPHPVFVTKEIRDRMVVFVEIVEHALDEVTEGDDNAS